MNKFSILAATTLLLAACQVTSFEEEDPGTNPGKGEKTMHFKLNPYHMDSMDEMPSNKSGAIHAPLYAAAAPKNATDHLLMGVYDSNGNLVDSIIYQDKNDPELAEYGKFTCRLKHGKYTILALGWNGSQKCIVHRQDSISFSEDWTPHTFLCRQNIVVSDSYSDTRTLSLKRCVAKFTLWFKNDKIPQDLGDFVVNVFGASSNLNGVTGYCAESNDFTHTILIKSDPTIITDMSAYCFMPSDSIGIDINIVAHNKNGDVIEDRTFTDVPMKLNYRTNYTGAFFSVGIDNSVEFDSEFNGDINVNF